MIKKFLLCLFLLFFLIVGTVIFFAFTQTGVQTLSSLAQRFVPGLTISELHGNLSNLSFNALRYRVSGIDVNINEGKLILSKRCLLTAKLCISNLQVQKSQINIDTASIVTSEKNENNTSLELSAPISLLIDHVAFSQLDLNIDGKQIHIDDFTTKAKWVKKALSVYPTELNGLNIHLSANQHIKSKKENSTSQPLGEKLKVLFREPLLTNLDSILLPLDIEIQNFKGHNWQLVTGEQHYQLDQINLQLETKKQRHIDVKKLTFVGPQINAKLEGKLAFTDYWPLDVSLQGKIFLPQGEQQLDLDLQGELRKEITLNANGNGLVNIALQGKTALATKGIPSQLQLTSEQLRWPLEDEKDADYKVTGLNVSLNGDVNNYQLITKANVIGNQLPSTNITLEGKGNLTQFTLTQLLVSLYQGTLETKGDVNWEDNIKWNATLTANHINTSAQSPNYPLIIDASIKTAGNWEAGNWALEFPHIDVQGNIKKQKIVIRGNVSGDSKGVWNFEQLNAMIGDNRINIDGNSHLDKQLALKADINAPNLTQILPELSGRITGNVNIEGSLNKPITKANIDINQLKWANVLKIDRALLIADVTSEQQINGGITVNITGIKGDSVDYSQLEFNLKGNEARHVLKVIAKGSPSQGEIIINGNFDRQLMQWKAVLEKSQLSSPIGSWDITKPVSINYSVNKNEIVIGDHCWETKASKICLPNRAIVGKSGEAKLVIDRFDTRIVNRLMGGSIALRGIISGDVQAKWSPMQTVPFLKVNIISNDFRAMVRSDASVLPFTFDTLSLTSQIDNNVLDLNVLAQLRNNGKVTSTIKIADLQQSKALSGDFIVDKITMDLIKPLLQKQDIVQGYLAGHLTFGGSLSDPLINGNIGVNKVKMSTNIVPIDMTDANINIHFSGKQSVLNGEIKSDEGTMTLTGEADWRDLEQWSAHIAAKGDKVRVVVPPMLEMVFTPDVKVEANTQQINLQGEVNIPWARITVESLPESAIGVSSDEILLDDKMQPVKKRNNKESSIIINSNLTITIGNDVHVSAYGLEADLHGKLKVNQSKGRLGLNGTVEIPNGRFHAYGQDLVINKGELIFSGPINLPSLNIEAIRNPDSIADNVTAGVKVTGLADEPKVEVFSDPSMSQQEALSYLLRGEGLSDGSTNSNNEMMTAILIGLGASQGGRVIGKVGEMFGINDLSLDTQGVGNSSQVVVSGNITKDLQVKYGIGIFDSLATLTLRYRLMPKLYLEIVSSLEQAVDLVYQFEF